MRRLSGQLRGLSASQASSAMRRRGWRDGVPQGCGAHARAKEATALAGGLHGRARRGLSPAGASHAVPGPRPWTCRSPRPVGAKEDMPAGTAAAPWRSERPPIAPAGRWSGDALGRETRDEALHEGLTGLELGDLDVFVRLMRLLDGAGAADHGGIAGLLELSGLGRVGDDVIGVVAGEGADETLGLAVAADLGGL